MSFLVLIAQVGRRVNARAGNSIALFARRRRAARNSGGGRSRSAFAFAVSVAAGILVAQVELPPDQAVDEGADDDDNGAAEYDADNGHSDRAAVGRALVAGFVLHREGISVYLVLD